MSPELINVIFQVSRWLFAFLGVFAALSAMGWLHAEKKARRERLRYTPAAGTVGELMVLSGGDDLPVQTWFPVTREGVLGSVRSCDLVVPCPGVRAHHLDFVWKDGVGLIIHPRSGCEAVVGDVTLNCRSDVTSHPLTHGACLQVGQAVLRLQVFRALNTAYAVPADAPVSDDEPVHSESVPFPGQGQPLYGYPAVPDSGFCPGMDPFSQSDVTPPPESPFVPVGAPPVQFQADPYAFSGYYPDPDVIPAVPETAPQRTDAVPAAKRRRSDSWKEDWSE